MAIFKKTKLLLVLVLVSCTHAGFLQNFIQSFTTGQYQQHPNSFTYSNRKYNSESSADDARENIKRSSGSGSYANSTSVASPRGGHGWGGWGWQGWQQQDQNLDLYSLLGGLSFASLLGATIIYLARRNTSSGRRKRSLDEDSLAEISDALEDPWWEKDKVQTVKLY